jgi:DNA repair protein RecO (recombination protein O)
MAETVRIEQEPAWLLHHRPFRDTSRILDLLTREHGRLSVVARGSRSAKSRLKGILRPFMPLSVSWVARSDLGTLTGAEIGGPPVSLAGDALLSGYYLNELLINLMHRHDPQPDIFDAYAATIRALAGSDDVAPRLRLFEIELLRLLGYALEFDRDRTSHAVLEPGQHYEYRAAEGPVAVDRPTGGMVFTGEELAAIARRRFDQTFALDAANRLLRGVIAYHLDGRELKSRKVLRDIRRSGRSRPRIGTGADRDDGNNESGL